MFSLPVLIARGLDLHYAGSLALPSVWFSGYKALFPETQNEAQRKRVRFEKEEETERNGCSSRSEGRNEVKFSLTLWPVGQVVKTGASHAPNGSSTLPRVTICTFSSAGRAADS